jgi:hypothetical protein
MLNSKVALHDVEAQSMIAARTRKEVRKRMGALASSIFVANVKILVSSYYWRIHFYEARRHH